MRTEKEIEQLYEEAIERSHAPSKFYGMTYEEGVRATLDWLQVNADNPLE